MDLLKKNLGLIIYAIVCLVLGVLITIGIKKASGTAKELQAKVAQQTTFFQNVRKNPYTISKNNLLVARENSDAAEKRFHDLRVWLATKYAVQKSPRMTSVECIEMLRKELERMQEYLRQKNILLGETARHLSFDSLAQASVLPPHSQLPLIWRQLQIVQEVVRLVAAAGVMEFNHLRRPMGLKVLEEELHTVTPVKIRVIGSLDDVQGLVNSFHSDSKYMFFLTYLSVESQDQAPRGRISGIGDQAPDARDSGMDGGMGMGMDEMGMGMGMGMDEMGMGRDGGMMQPGGRLGRPGMRDDGSDDRRRIGLDDEEEKPTRKDHLVFTDRPVVAEMRFDMLEFVQPESEEE